MNARLYVPIYALTLTLSAALLFSVQPMFSKMILPMLGGAPQVWNTAMLFFQVILLAGYAYAHGLSHIANVKIQSFIHLVIMAVFVLVLPIAIPEGWVPPLDKDPTLWQLSLMALVVGGPFFALSGSAPLFQKWFAYTDHKDAENPYFLYGASNFGSMSALLAYPFLIEPFAALHEQAFGWMVAYIILIGLVIFCAALVWPSLDKKTKTKKKTKAKTKKTAVKKASKKATLISWPLRFKWLALAFVPSSLMLGVTTYITSEVASVPLLWIVPLAIYVGTFILVFARKPILERRKIMLYFSLSIIILLGSALMFPVHNIYLLPLHLIVFSFAAYACHTELASLRPKAEKLTEFYLVMSIGGALGGFFNAIVAPQIFIIPLEYAIVLAGACFLRYSAEKKPENELKKPMYFIATSLSVISVIILHFAPYPSVKTITVLIIVGALAFNIEKRYLFSISVFAVLAFFPPGHMWGQNFFKKVLHQDRNFFGIVKVIDTAEDQRIFLHGITNHGTQALDEKYRLEPLSYYNAKSPIRDSFNYFDERPGKQRIAVLGLGIGVTACFQKDGRFFDFYEINNQVIEIAENPDYFTFLSDCGSPYEIIRGDGRLAIQDKPDGFYDLIVLDAFSSDNIPAHLVTKEAVEIYLKKLNANGALLFNISNNYLDIEPVLSQIAKTLDVPAYARFSRSGKLPDSNITYYPAHFFSFSNNALFNKHLRESGWTEGRFRDGVALWTDQYSNIVSVLGNKVGKNRLFEKTPEEAEK